MKSPFKVMGKKKKVLLFLSLGIIMVSLGVLSFYLFKSDNIGATDSDASGSSGKDVVTYTVVGPGKIQGTTKQVLSKGELGTPVKAIPNAGSEFRGWSRTTEVPSRRESGTGTNRTIIAYFQKRGEERDMIEYIIAQPELGTFADGTTSPIRRYLLNGEQGLKVEVKAIGDAEFIGWSDGVAKKARADVGDGEYHRYVATFKKKSETTKNRYEYTVEGGSNVGYIEGRGVQYLSLKEKGEVVIARPTSAAYVFVEWSDGLKDAQRRDTGDGKKKLLTAKFQKVGGACGAVMKNWSYSAETSKGYIQGDRVQSGDNGCAYGKAVRAVAYDGYRFKNWAVKQEGSSTWVKDKSSQATSAYRWDKDAVELMAIFDTLK